MTANTGRAPVGLYRAFVVMGLAADRDAVPSAVACATNEAACARAEEWLGIRDVVRAAGQTHASASPVGDGDSGGEHRAKGPSKRGE